MTLNRIFSYSTRLSAYKYSVLYAENRVTICIICICFDKITYKNRTLPHLGGRVRLFVRTEVSEFRIIFF